MRVYLDDLDSNTGSAWRYFPRQLVSYPGVHAPLEAAARLEARVLRVGRWLLLAVLAGAVAAQMFARRRPRSQLPFDLCALAVPSLFFVALSGITFWTGPRIVYPASVPAVAMAAAALRGMAGLRLLQYPPEWIRRRIGHPPVAGPLDPQAREPGRGGTGVSGSL